MALGPGRAGAPGDFRLRRTALSRAELSSLLRAVESFGLVAEEAVPWHFALDLPQGDVFIDDVGLRIGTPVALPGFELATGGARAGRRSQRRHRCQDRAERAQPAGGRGRPGLAGGEPAPRLLCLSPGCRRTACGRAGGPHDRRPRSFPVRRRRRCGPLSCPFRAQGRRRGRWPGRFVGGAGWGPRTFATTRP